MAQNTTWILWHNGMKCKLKGTSQTWDLGEWLHTFQVFICTNLLIIEENHINGHVLLDLDNESLKSLNVNLLGHRMKIMIIVGRLRKREADQRKQTEEEAKRNSYTHRMRNYGSLERSGGLGNGSSSSGSPDISRTKSNVATPGKIGSRSPNVELKSSAVRKAPEKHSPLNRRRPSAKDDMPTHGLNSANSSGGSSNFKKKIIKVIGEQNQSRTVDVTGVNDLRALYAKIFQKFSINYDRADEASLDREIQNWSLWAGGADGLLRQLKDEDALSIPVEVTSFEQELPRVYLKRRAKASNTFKKLENFFGVNVPPNRNINTSAIQENRSPVPSSPIVDNFMNHNKLKKFFNDRPTSESISDNFAKYFPNIKTAGKSKAIAEPQKISSSPKPTYPAPISVQSPSNAQEGNFKFNTITRSNSKVDTAARSPVSANVDRSAERSQDHLAYYPQKDNGPEEIETFEEVPAVEDDPLVPPENDNAPKTPNPITINTMANTPTSTEPPSPVGAELKRSGTRKIKWVKGALIGTGSFGNVYLGLNAQTGELMAVKQVVLPEVTGGDETITKSQLRKKVMVEALQREILLLKELEHPNIVCYLGSESTDKYLNIFLEYVAGGSLSSVLKDYGNLEEPLIKSFIKQILHGLAYLHDKKIVHRDIKGGNILVDNKGIVKISDFGISKKLSGGNDRGSLVSVAKQNRTSTLQGSGIFYSF